MGLKPTFTSFKVRAKLEADLDKILRAFIATLAYLGEMCVNEARNSGSYSDQTGNLRSSIGYVIVHDGKIVKEDFKRIKKITKSKKPLDGYTGMDSGLSLAHTLATKINGIGLIVVAGMNYAVYVEAMEFNVLTTAEALCKSKFKPMMKQLQQKIAKK